MKKILSLTMMLMIFLTGCDTDFFNSNCREIGKSNYSLCRDKNGTVVFYLEPAHQAPSGGGILEGTVRSIGWSDKVIIAFRQSTFRGDPDGPMVIDIANKKVDGPITQEVVAKKYPYIKFVNASDVWASLQ